MQDAHVGNWTRESLVSAEMLDSLRGLNHRFLDLIGTHAGDWNVARRVGLSLELSGQVAPLSPLQKQAAANCPYALFDLRFSDDAHWRGRLQTGGGSGVSDEAALDERTLDFVRLALFFAWHVASTAKFAARFLLGMNDVTAAALRRITIDRLPALAASEAVHLTARWSEYSTYWSALTGAAARPNAAMLRRIQLSGLQLAAAVELT